MNKKLIVSWFCIFLLVMLPICFADEFEETGETLIIEAKQQEPEILRSDFVEQLNVPVFITLGAIRGSPISVPEIKKNIKIEVIKPEQAIKENASVKGTSKDVLSDYIYGTPSFHSAPVPTLENLGYLKITLKKIPKESEVPESIDLDLKATIPYEAELAGFTIGGENTFDLKQETEEEAEQRKQDRAILGGRAYLRVASISGDEATIQLYDEDFEKKRRVTLEEGEISSSITLSSGDEVQPERIRLKLEEVTNAGAIRLLLKDEKEIRTFDLKEVISSDWKITYYTAGEKDKDTGRPNKDTSYIILTHPNFKFPVVLTGEDGYRSVASLKTKVQACGTTCKVYADCAIKALSTRDYQKEDFLEALSSLERIGLEKFEGIQEKSQEVYAQIELSGEGVKRFYEGDKIGNNGQCKVSRVSSEYIMISGIKTWDKERRDSEKLEVDQTELLCGDQLLTLKGITTEQVAKITVLPGAGEGKATSYFSIHIPIEKRAIEYTPEELQQKINKTQATIKKLDKTIADLEKLVESWTKVCLAVAAVFTVMAFFQGMSGPKTTKKEPGVNLDAVKDKVEDNVWLKMSPPAGTSFAEFTYYSGEKGREVSLTEEPYYFNINDQNMYPNQKKNPIAHIDAVFKNSKTKDWYRLALNQGNNEVVFVNEGKTPTQGSYGSGDNSGKYDVKLSQNGNEVSIGLQSCNQLPAKARRECDAISKQYGDALTLVYTKQPEKIEVWWNGKDSKFYRHKNGIMDGDMRAFMVTDPQEFDTVKKRMVDLEDSYKRGEQSYSWGLFRKYNLNKGGLQSSGPEGVECQDVMSEGQCKILFNACDPVMCPPSRCDFNHRYRVDNVIQSGLLGSLLLCLPNIKEGVIMPVCLSGILAALKNIRSILQGYVNCLQSALNDDESVGICDRIRSVFICEILWREAMTMLGLAKGNLFDAVATRGGGEYLTGLRGGVANAKQTVDYFTKNYATSVFASYNAKSSKELGTEICEKAIYGKTPLIGDIVGEVTKAQNPPQFTAYIEEQPYSEIRKHQSAYKLYYHIYAGSQKVDYKVYLKKDSKTYVCDECQGIIKEGEFVDKSVAFFNEEGYNQICVLINGVTNCNFGKIVSSSFALSAANDYIIQRELSKNIQTEDECRSDSRGYMPNVQVEKKCSVGNPGVGKGTREAELWSKIGTCGKNKQDVFLGDCWIKLGDLAESNPEAYRGAMSDLCQEKNGKVCDLGETCTGRGETTTVSGGYKSVICCYEGECKADIAYDKIKSQLKEKPFVKGAYSDMLSEGVKICENEDISANDPFAPGYPPISWSSEKLEGRRGEEKYDQFHYFKGMMYLICKNCDKAQEEFVKVSDSYTYFKEICGENLLEKDKGGLMFERCSMNCEGDTPKETQPTAPGTPTTPEVKGLQLKEFILKDPYGNPKTITKDTKEIKLETGGKYTMEKMVFNDPVKSCSFYFGAGDLKTVVSDATICVFTENNDFSTTGVEPDKSYLYILGVSRDDEENVYANIFDVKLVEKSAQEGQILLCENPAKTQAFCLYATSEYKGKRCSDFSYDNINYKYSLDEPNPNSCNTKCKTYGDCITKNTLYLTPQLVTDRGILVQ